MTLRAINIFPLSLLHCFLSRVPGGNPTVSHTWDQPRATTSTYLMQQPPQLLMIKYKGCLLGNFSGQKARSLPPWAQKAEELLGLQGDLGEIAVSISYVCNRVSSCLPKRHCRTACVWEAKHVFSFQRGEPSSCQPVRSHGKYSPSSQPRVGWSTSHCDAPMPPLLPGQRLRASFQAWWILPSFMLLSSSSLTRSVCGGGRKCQMAWVWPFE